MKKKTQQHYPLKVSVIYIKTSFFWFHSFTLHDEVTPCFWCFCVVYRAFQVKGRIITYFVGLSKRPLTVFGIFLSIVTSLILLTICISTILYCNAVKKSRINPESNYIKVVRRIKWEISDTKTGTLFIITFKKMTIFFTSPLLFVNKSWSTYKAKILKFFTFSIYFIYWCEHILKAIFF